jgi:uncharacterized membrane protein (Fun14 family)
MYLEPLVLLSMLIYFYQVLLKPQEIRRFFMTQCQIEQAEEQDQRGPLLSPSVAFSRGVFASHHMKMGLVVDLARYDDMVLGLASGPNHGSNGKKPQNQDDDVLNRFFEKISSHMTEISFGGAVGFCSGYAVKQVGKVAACTIGVIFILSQVAANNGYIHINWRKVEKDVIRSIDPEGDGRITKKDLKLWWIKFMKMVQYNLPSSSGFGVGFVLGISCA